MREPVSHDDLFGILVFPFDSASSVLKEVVDPLKEAGWDSHSGHLSDEARFVHFVVGCGHVYGSQDCSFGFGSVLKVIHDILAKSSDLFFSASVFPEAGLSWGEAVVSFKNMSKAALDHSFRSFADAAGEANRSVAGRFVFGFPWFGDRDDSGSPPKIGDIASTPGYVDDGEKGTFALHRKFFKHTRSDQIRACSFPFHFLEGKVEFTHGEIVADFFFAIRMIGAFGFVGHVILFSELFLDVFIRFRSADPSIVGGHHVSFRFGVGSNLVIIVN